MKLLRHPVHFSSINIVSFKKKYYLLNEPNVPTLFPTLIDLPALSCITFENVTITPDHVLTILQNLQNTSFPFSIKVFTAYSFIKHYSKQLCTNMIGQYISTNQSCQKSLYIFVTPSLERNIFYLHQLPDINHNHFNRVNPFTVSPHSEGKRTNIKTTSVPKIANQKECICQHVQTQEMSLPKKFNNLGNILKQNGSQIVNVDYDYCYLLFSKS